MAEPNHKTLAQTLGFSPGESVFVETTPDWYSQFADDTQLELEAGLPATHAHIFCSHEAELVDFLEYNDLNDLEKSLWISWPTKASGMQTDLDEKTVKDAVLPLGWRDTKTASVDDDWSSLQFVRANS